MYIANCSLNKIKILCKAKIGPEKNFRMMYSNLCLNSRETVPLISFGFNPLNFVLLDLAKLFPDISAFYIKVLCSVFISLLFPFCNLMQNPIVFSLMQPNVQFLYLEPYAELWTLYAEPHWVSLWNLCWTLLYSLWKTTCVDFCRIMLCYFARLCITSLCSLYNNTYV